MHDDETVVAGSKSKIYCHNKVDAINSYDNSPQAQMDSGACMSVMNLISLLHNVKFFNVKFKNSVYTHGATSKQTIKTRAVGYMRVRSLTKQGFIDIKCYYSLHFSTTLL